MFIFSILLFSAGFIGFSQFTQVQFEKIQSQSEISKDVIGFLESLPKPISMDFLKSLVSSFRAHSKKNICILDQNFQKIACPGKVDKYLPIAKTMKDESRLIRNNLMILGPFTLETDVGQLKMFVWKKRRVRTASGFSNFLLKNSNQMIMVFAIILCAIPWLFLSYTFFKPLSKLIHIMDAMANGDFSQSVDSHDKDRNDILGGLAKVLHRMQMAVAKTHESNRTLVARVAHEIHTPLTRIKLASGLIMKKAPAIGIDKHIEDIEKDCTELATISNELMDLSRVSSGRASGEIQYLKINTLIDQELTQFEALYADKQLYLDKQLTILDSLRGYEKELALVFKNIFDNIYKYAKHGSLVRISSRIEREHLTVECINTSDYTPPSEDLFEPFVHTSGHDKSHGLGLSFVKQVMTMHGGSVSAHYGRNMFSLELQFPLVEIETQPET